MVKFLKVRQTKDPTRNAGDAGIDFFIPDDTDQFVTDLMMINANSYLTVKSVLVQDKDSKEVTSIKRIFLPPNTDLLIPSGIKSKIDENYAIQLNDKSGICFKSKLKVGAKLIDSSYQGEIHFHLFNMSSDVAVLDFGQKITQGVVIKHYPGEFSVVDGTTDTENTTKEFFDKVTERGEGGFGSTGT